MESRPATWRGELVGTRPWSGRVLSTHAGALNVLRDDGLVVSLVSDERDLTAMSVVVPGGDGSFPAPGGGVGSAVDSDGKLIVIPGVMPIDTSKAEPWSGRLRGLGRIPRWALIEAKAALLGTDRPRAFALLLAPQTARSSAIATAAREALDAWERGPPPGRSAALSELVGLGPGLTPAGDDFLVGALLADLTNHRTRIGFGGRRIGRADRRAMDAALTGTSAPGRTLLFQALRRRFPAYLLELLRALRIASLPVQVHEAVSAACAHGSTSGSDALAGFLWMQGEARGPAREAFAFASRGR